MHAFMMTANFMMLRKGMFGFDLTMAVGRCSSMMSIMPRPMCVPLGALWMMLIIGGCGSESGPTRYHVSGTVTHSGTPIPQGVIQFLPDSAKGNEGPAVNANIVQGKYDTTVSGKGTVGGAHVVVINGFDGEARPADELPLGKPLFGEYRTNVDLPQSTGETVNFEVQP